MPFYSPSTRGFYTKQIHGRSIPADAIEISNEHHQRLILAQAQGHGITHAKGAVMAVHPHAERDDLLEVTRAGVKREARKRILRIASLERQSNDNAVLALAALKRVKSDSNEFVAAMERRQKIDAVRAASNRIEEGLAGHSHGELQSFKPELAAWPEL